MKKKEFKLTIKGSAIVLIDWANIRNQQKKLGWKIDLEILYNWISSHKEVEKIQFFYGYKNTDKSREFLKKVESFGYEVITKEVKYLKKEIFINKQWSKAYNLLSQTIESNNNISDALVTLLYDYNRELEKLGRKSDLNSTLLELSNTQESAKTIVNESFDYFKKLILVPKCDLDAEIVTEIMKNFAEFQTIILFSGDGDFAYTIKECLNDWKKVYVISGFKKGEWSSLGKEIWAFKNENPAKYPAIINLNNLKFLKKIPANRS